LNKTKIIATLGPKSFSPSSIRSLILSGVNVFRLNMSHIHDFEDLKNMVQTIRVISENLKKQIGILMDIAGPKVRVRSKLDEIKVKKGDVLTIGYKNSDIMINLNPSFKKIDLKSKVKIDDGKISFSVFKKNNNKQLQIKCLNGGTIINGKGVNFPNIELSFPTLTNKDIEDIKSGIKLDIDWFALSFVRSDDDFLAIRSILDERDSDKPVIAKIEKPEAIENLSSIIQAFDGILVARGDLGVEMGYEMVPIAQKKIVRLCHKYGKPIILATQMLESMIYNDSPTRAEVNDVAVAVEQSCDAVMLSAETAVGKYPVESIKMMKSIINQIESDIFEHSDYKAVKSSLDKETEVQSSICYSAARMANRLGIKTIIAMTESGSSALSIASCRPKASIIAMSPDKEVSKKLSLIWGLETISVEDFQGTDDMMETVQDCLVKNKILKKNDKYVIIAGVPVGISGTTNMIRIERIS
tara:strand:+ start:2541 stop:3950 length:1410 start_codon:yes stop_codon:yes gene_type:complete